MSKWPIFALALAVSAAQPAAADKLNGFELSGALVPEAEIFQGGPPRDGIPPIDAPRFVSASEARFLRPEDRVLGIARNGIAKAYPVAILNWHEIVNDRFSGEPVVVSFCPLCGTGMAFRATAGGRALGFGVSGLLYNSDVLFYDRETESLWSQIAAKAIAGPLKGTALEQVPLAHTTWSDWRARHPQSLVLSTRTGFARDYARNPYELYARSERIMFPVSAESARYHPKEQVIGVRMEGRAKAYPFVELFRAKGPVRDRIGGREVTVRFDASHRTGIVTDAEGREIPSVIAFWFAWYAFHPDGEVYTQAH